jgi:hypothetical protein
VPKRKDSNDLTVQAKDTYDERDYISVHRKYFDGLRDAVKRAHGGACICIYCRHSERAELETSAMQGSFGVHASTSGATHKGVVDEPCSIKPGDNNA